MKTRITLLCLWGVLAASAQDTTPTDLPEHLRSERSRLSLEKTQAATAYSDALKRCYQQIDVNSCKLKAQDIKIQADVEPEQLYTEGPMSHEFPRTASRLREMQSAAFLALGRRVVDTSLT